MIVTTSDHVTDANLSLAEKFARQLELPFVPRQGESLAKLKQKWQAKEILVVTQERPEVVTTEGRYFFHLNLAELRIKNLRHGKHDHMIEALALSPGDSVLDCTLGLGSDAIVASYQIGANGRIVGLEASPIIAAIAEDGLHSFRCQDLDLEQALRRIQVVTTEAEQYLRALPNDSFDVVYFDPMFRQPVAESSHLKPLRLLARQAALTQSVIKEAYRVAQKRVVMKEKQGSPEFARLGFFKFQGGRYSTIQFGVLSKENEKL